MDVSIVIPTKNGGQQFKAVIEAVFNQKTNYTYEVICIDSGSSDETLTIIKQYDIRLFQIAPSTFGHGKTRNYGASKSQGKYIVFITQDALPANETWLDSFISAMEAFPDAVGGFGRHLPYPNCNIFDARDINGLFAGFGDENKLFYIEDEKRYKEEEGYRHLLAFYSDNNSCMRRDVWEKFPYDDVNFAEDQIWARRIIEAGYKKLYCPQAVVYHSHNYTLKTYFGRYFDEYKGLWELHQFRIAYTVPSAIKRCMKHILSEWAYTYRQNLPILKKVYWLHYSFWRNIYRYRAGYMAGKYHIYSSDKQEKLDKKYSQQYQQRSA